jgi:hypothetical protein
VFFVGAKLFREGGANGKIVLAIEAFAKKFRSYVFFKLIRFRTHRSVLLRQPHKTKPPKRKTLPQQGFI